MSTRPYALQEIESQAQALQDAQQTLSSAGAHVVQLLQPAPPRSLRWVWVSSERRLCCGPGLRRHYQAGGYAGGGR